MTIYSIRGKLILTFLSSFSVLLIISVFFVTELNKTSLEIEQAVPITSEAEGTVEVPADTLQSMDGTDLVQAHQSLLVSIDNRNEKIKWGIVLAATVFTLMLAAGAFWIILSLSKSLKNPVHILNNLVQGNTTVDVKTSKDELMVIIQAARQLSENLKHSSNFAYSIGEGNFNFDFTPVSAQDVLGNSLVQMREKLKNIAEADKKRNWTTEGLAMFADLIRKGGDLQKMNDALIRELVKYTNANQGGLFILNQDNKSDPFLELTACYAYDRKKHMVKRVEIGTGLLGQCFLEGAPVYLTQVPKDYVTITSGLGSGNPTCLLITPLKLNDSTEGVIELASFHKFEIHQIEFVQRIAEVVASAIAGSRITERTKKMLEESQHQSEQMRAQEEEMRQNMEEMQATHETMERQAAEMKKMQVNLELEKSMFNVLMEFLPDRITYKDTESRIMRINKAKAQRLNMKPEEVIGKTDYDFFTADHAEKAMREEKELIDSGKPLLDTEERLVFNNGDTAWVSTSRIPFKNENNKTTGMFIITKDITKLKNAELSLQERDNIIHSLIKELPIFHYKVNKEKIIYDSWMGNSKAGIPDASQIKSRMLEDIFPKVSECIQDDNIDGRTNACIDKLAATGVVFKHYIFKDSLHPGFFWIYAVMQH